MKQGESEQQDSGKKPNSVCSHQKSCKDEILRNFLTSFRNGFLIKLILRLATERSL